MGKVRIFGNVFGNWFKKKNQLHIAWKYAKLISCFKASLEWEAGWDVWN